ncbi:hypothetical protein SCUCBS95973_001665 [Sporothrix curviconia]|uniref:AT hook domain-containing protein n=1 Tax=Sporothrix curviconia TaxID=1260050 RepID=A0ABP0B0F5_9PEZI
MSASRQEVFDSDDNGDDLSPLSSPLASPRLSPFPLHEEPSQLELVELPELPGLSGPSEQPTLPFSTNPADVSTSTDPSFFRDVYEEQQRALGAQLNATTNEYDNQAAEEMAEETATVAVAVPERDPWEVPSSPIEVAGQQRGSYLKRKRNEELQRANDDVPVAVQLNGDGGSREPATKQRRRTTTVGSGLEHQGMGLEISIPLEPLTPSRMHQYPQLLSSSIDNSLALPLSRDESLPHIHAVSTYQAPYDATVPADAVTQSTVAFTTPSMYASSGRRAVGSSSSNHNTNSRQLKSSHDMDIIQENDTIAVSSATPPRQARKTADMAHIMSSPDVIAEPASLRGPPRPQSPVVDEHDENERDAVNEEDDEWEAPTSRRGKTTARSTQRRPQRRSSVDDELSISIDIPVQSKALHEIDESDTSCDSPPRADASKTKHKQTKAKAVVIAASDDDDDDSDGGRIDDLAPPPHPADSESDFSDAGPKKKSTAKSKKAQKKKGTAADPVPEQPKRSRGRPKKAKLNEDEGGAQTMDPDNDYEALVRDVLPGAERDTEADSRPEGKSVAQAKGKRGRKTGKGGKGRKDSNAETAPTETATNDAALSTTSGNASLPGSFKAEANGEENVEARDEEKSEEADKKQPLPNDSKPTPAPAGLPSGLLSTGLNTTSMGRVPYRVGLSKKFRIAPLLKVIRK